MHGSLAEAVMVRVVGPDSGVAVGRGDGDAETAATGDAGTGDGAGEQPHATDANSATTATAGNPGKGPPAADCAPLAPECRVGR